MSTYTEYFTAEDILRQQPITLSFPINGYESGEADSIWFGKFKFNGIDIPKLMRAVDGGEQSAEVESGTASASLTYLCIEPSAVPTFNVIFMTIIDLKKRTDIMNKIAEVREGKVKGEDFTIELSSSNKKQVYLLDQEWAQKIQELPVLRPKNKNFGFSISMPGDFDTFSGAIENGPFLCKITISDLTLKKMDDKIDVACTTSTEKRVYRPSTSVSS